MSEEFQTNKQDKVVFHKSDVISVFTVDNRFFAFNFLYNYFDDCMIAKTILLFICLHVIQIKSTIFAMSVKLCNQSDKAF